MSYEEFRKRINTARDILVGAVPSPAGQIDQITYALMYKFMNDLDDQSAALGGKRTYFVGDYAKYNWHELMSPTLGAHERLELYRHAIQTMAKNPGLPPLFQEIYQNAFLPFNSPNVLNLFLKEIDKFSHGESDDIGDAYEYLLSITGAQGDVGQFRTPRHIIKFIVEAVNPTKSDSVLDPAAGTAGFLIAAYNHVKSQHDGKDANGIANSEKHLTADELTKLHKNYHGFDIDPTMVRTASVNMYLHGFTTPDIRNHDTLSSEDYWNERYDVILANPPFMTPKGGIQPHKKFSINANRAEVLFVDYIASHLNPVSGRAGIVVPEGIIFQSGNAYKQLRKNLIENSLIAVVSLPAGVFNPYAGVKTSVLILDKKLAKERNEVLFVKIENDGYSLGAQRRSIAGEQFTEALNTIEQFKNGETIESSLAHAVPRESIAESGDYNLSSDRYKQVISAQDSAYKLVELSDVIELNFGTRITKKDSEGTKYPVYGGGGRSFYTDTYNRSDEYVVSRFAMSENCVRFVRGDFFMLDSGFTFSVKDESLVLKDYVGSILLNTQSAVYACARGHAQKNIDVAQFKAIKIPLPPLEIQQKIVDEIENKQKAIDHAREIIKTLERERAYFDPSPRAQKEGWPIVKLRDITDVRDGTHDSPKFVQDGYPLVTSKNVKDGEINFDNVNLISQADYDAINKRSKVDDGDIIMPMIGTIGGAVVVKKERSFAIKNVALIKPAGDGVDFGYLILALNSNSTNARFTTLSAGATQKFVSLGSIRNLEIPLPPLETQKQIVAEFAEEQKIATANKKLIDLYQAKIKSKLAEVWEDEV